MWFPLRIDLLPWNSHRLFKVTAWPGGINDSTLRDNKVPGFEIQFLGRPRSWAGSKHKKQVTWALWSWVLRSWVLQGRLPCSQAHSYSSIEALFRLLTLDGFVPASAKTPFLLAFHAQCVSQHSCTIWEESLSTLVRFAPCSFTHGWLSFYIHCPFELNFESIQKCHLWRQPVSSEAPWVMTQIP